MGPTTYRLAARAFEFEPLGQLTLKGKARPVESYRVVRPREEPVGLGSTPLVGRSSELGLLRQALARALLGQGGVATVRGEAGVGKSRLLAEFMGGLGAGIDRWTARGASYDRQTPYAVLASLLRSAFGIRQTDNEQTALARLERRLHELALDIDAATVRLLLEVLGYTAEPGFDPQVRRRVLVEVMRNVIRKQVTLGPLLNVAEDLHWMDSASPAVLADLAQDLASLPCLLIATGRPEWEPPWRSERIELWTLDETEARELITRCLGAIVEPSLLETMLSKTGGNPFFVEQLARSLQESGAIARDGGRWVLLGSAELVVPDSAQEALGARIDRLEAGPNRVIRAAAVVGRTFWYRVVERLGPSPTLVTDLEHLLGHGFVERRASSPEVTYAFRHALIQEVAYLKQLFGQANALEQHRDRASKGRPIRRGRDYASPKNPVPGDARPGLRPSPRPVCQTLVDSGPRRRQAVGRRRNKTSL